MPEHDKKRKQGGRGDGGGGGDGGDKKAMKKAKYYGGSRGSGQALPHGQRGMIVTCDVGREDRAGGEAVALIEEHYDKLAAEAAKGGAAAAAEEGGAAAAAAPQKDGEGKEGVGKDSGGGSKDIAALLAEEVAALKDKKAARFRVHHTGVKGVLFVVFPGQAADKEGGAEAPAEAAAAAAPAGPGPVEVAQSIAEEAAARKQARGRHVMRFLPVTHTCFAGMDEISAVAPKVLAGHFPDGEGVAPVEYAVDYEHRSSEGFDRLKVINAFTDHIKTPPHKVNLKTPALTVLVQLVRNGCGMAVVGRYKELGKFNVRKLAEVEEGAEA